MHWEFMYGNLDHYEARLREIEQEQLAHRVWLATHPLPQFARRMQARLGRRLVVWGLALQSRIGGSDDLIAALVLDAFPGDGSNKGMS